MTDDIYKTIFLVATASLDQFDLVQACEQANVPVNNFYSWVKSCPVTKAKWNEVADSRNVEAKKK